MEREFEKYAELVWRELRSVVGAIGQTGWRPFLGWALSMGAAIGGGSYCIAIGIAALHSAAHGVPMPDMSGGLGPMVIALGGALISAGGRGLEKWARDKLGAAMGGGAMGPGAAMGEA